MDYNEEMLRLYFKEKGYSKEEIDFKLNTNPFDRDFSIWEKQTINNSKTFSINLKNKHLITPKTSIQEITIDKNISIGRFLENSIEYSICSINNNINKIKSRNKLVLIKGIYPGQSTFLKNLSNYNVPFITGICSKDINYYERAKKIYKSISKEIKDAEFFEYNLESNKKLCMLIKK